jgi:DNA polymerase III epsilon subunit-like protein
MKLLFFDTETTGLPKDYKAPITAVDNWPRLVQLAWIYTEPDGRQLARGEAIIRPDGWEISPKAAAVHGITTERASAEGQPVKQVLADFLKAMLAEPAVVLVAHNIDFDYKIVGAEMQRLGYTEVLQKYFRLRMICTMRASTNYVAIPTEWGFKWPKLQELHRKLFAEDFAEAHNAAADINATARCYFELVKLNIIRP